MLVSEEAPTPCRDDDENFLRELVRAWDVRSSFSRLAQDIAPPVPQRSQVLHVESLIAQHVRRVWPTSSADLQLIGSTSFGTDILKGAGDQSDRDYSLTLDTGDIFDGEWHLFFEQLELDENFLDVQKGRKAIRFTDRFLRVPWEIVPTQGHFTYDSVPYPTLQGSRWRSGRNRCWLDFYNTYGDGLRFPGARNATRILKRFLPSLKGHVIEGLVFSQGQVMMKQDPEVALGDTTGMYVFQRLLQSFYLYPAVHHGSPLRTLLRDAEQHDSDADSLHRSFLAVKDQVAAFYQMVYPDLSEVCCLPTWFLRALMRACAVFVGIALSFLFWFMFVPALRDLQFSQRECENASCACNDCNQDAWERWQNDGVGSTCVILGLALDRCRIRHVTRMGRCWGHFLLVGHAFSSLGLRPPTRSTSTVLRSIVLFQAVLHFLSHMTDLSDRPRATLSCLLLNTADTCRLSISILIFLHGLRSSGAIGCVWSQAEILCWCFLKWFLTTVILLQCLAVLHQCYLLDDSALPHKDVMFQQRQLFLGITVVLDACLALCGCCLCVSAQTRRICRGSFLVQAASCWMVYAHLYKGIFHPGSFSRLSFIANLGKTAAIGLRCVLALRFARATDTAAAHARRHALDLPRREPR